MQETDYATQLRALAESLGVELYGVASAADYGARFPDKPQPSRFVEGAQSVIVIGLPYTQGTVETVLRPELAGLRSRASDDVGTQAAVPQGAERFFLTEESAALTTELTLIAYKLVRDLQRHGWKALHLPAGKQNDRFRTAPFYHMPAMFLAGLGTLGLNCCILTPQFGPRVRVMSIISDCPLPAGRPMDQDMCRHCNLCVNNCPMHAIDGKGWKNPYACASYGCCATCMAICPVGTEPQASA